ncbi:LytR/AlgR family response regulator transcription factor [Pedobacter duraquae]|uniref:LytTR family two component transcriptional regulator n=1 Tax=Pedobacter duraquae TaxID=425511 RepID=A0A4R6IKQ7_9SPHI|nr:LytTR family DNA-binding domain-containing protein [Pedobacter duraquae]TDO22662.1 LytTR family two component transcriptional regulator [Pedobacter duraquae]
MKRLTCIAIDDEPLALELIREYTSRCPVLNLLYTFEDAIQGAEYLNHHPVDLLFIDINMPDITGIDLVRTLTVRPMVIFTTAYKNFAYEGFELDALDFLLKPIDFARFSKTITKAVLYQEYRQQPKSVATESIYVHADYKLVRIALQEVAYIESFGDYVTIHLLNDKAVSSLMSLKKVLEKLPEKQFIRIHRSYVVPASQIKMVHNRKVSLNAGRELPIGNSYLPMVNEWLKL